MDVSNSKLPIELPIFLAYFGMYLSEPINMNFLISRTCDVSLGHNNSDCVRLGLDPHNNSTAELEKLSEPYAYVILTTVKTFSLIISAIYCLFIGAWSDKNGRKPVLLKATFGLIILFLIRTVVSLVSKASPWYLMFECVPIIFTGGFPVITMICICYLSDKSTEDNRGKRMSLFEIVSCSGIFAGIFSSSYLLKLVGYAGVFSFAAVSQLIALILFYFVKESITDRRELDQENSSLFTTKYIRDMFKTIRKKRENYGKRIFIMLIGLLVLFNLVVSGFDSFFLYVRAKFEWTLLHFTMYTCFSTVLWISGSFLGNSVMHKRLKIPEITLLLVAFLASSFGYIVQAFAMLDWVLYIGAYGVAIVSGIISPMVRSLISKEVPADEVGKIFSLTVALETGAKLVGGPIYTTIYNTTITIFPGMFNLFTCAIYFTAAIIVVNIKFLKIRISEGETNNLMNESQPTPTYKE